MTTKRSDQENAGRQEHALQTQFFIYKNLAYVSEQRFVQKRISIGSSPKADVILEHQSIADIHALVHFEGGKAFLSNKFPNDGLRLNGRSVHLETLQHEDVIDLGPFSLKIKMSAVEAAPVSPVNATYAVRLVNHYDSTTAMSRAAQNLAHLLRVDVDKIVPLIIKEHVVIKRNLAGSEATRWENALRRAGINCDVQEEGKQPPTASAGTGSDDAAQSPGRQKVPAAAATPDTPDAGAPPLYASGFTIDEDDDEDELWEAAFTLQQELAYAPQPGRSGPAPVNVQIVKTIGSSVIDVDMLGRGQKYFVHNDDGRTCLVRFHPKRGAAVSITPQMHGFVENARGQVTADLDSYKTENYSFGRGRQHYHVPVPDRGAVVVEDASCRYRILLAKSTPSPEVTVAAVPAAFTWRHWAWSVGAHFFFLLALSVVLYFQATAARPQSPYFVKIDPSLIRKLEALKAPPPPKIEPPPKPEPQPVAEKLEPPKQKPVKQKAAPIRHASRSKHRNRKVVAMATPDRHPNAGGGFGQGNIKNRNINQTGILSVLSTTAAGGPGEAVAAVTNLDAVPVPGAGEENFTVGGLKGSLGSGKISVASGEIVQTKGSQQILRSAGARGKGDVAALERGSTGRRQVQAMVTARMSRTVKIEGGMSREMVKRVIDQHLQEITYCYETALMSNPGILGRIVFEWKILMDGSVGEIRIAASSINSHEIHDCIKSAIRSWRFPKPVGTEVIVSYPFVFDLVAF